MKSVYSFIAPDNLDIDFLKLLLLHNFTKATIEYEFGLKYNNLKENFKINKWTNENTLYVHPTIYITMDQLNILKDILLTLNFTEGYSL